MKEIINEIINKLALTNHSDVRDFKNDADEVSFIFRNVKFYLVAEVFFGSNEDVGRILTYNYLRVPVSSCSHYKIIENFDVLVYKNKTIQIKNYENQSNSLKSYKIDNEGYITCNLEQIQNEYFNQLESKLIKKMIPVTLF